MFGWIGDDASFDTPFVTPLPLIRTSKNPLQGLLKAFKDSPGGPWQMAFAPLEVVAKVLHEDQTPHAEGSPDDPVSLVPFISLEDGVFDTKKGSLAPIRPKAPNSAFIHFSHVTSRGPYVTGYLPAAVNAPNESAFQEEIHEDPFDYRCFHVAKGMWAHRHDFIFNHPPPAIQSFFSHLGLPALYRLVTSTSSSSPFKAGCVPVVRDMYMNPMDKERVVYLSTRDDPCFVLIRTPSTKGQQGYVDFVIVEAPNREDCHVLETRYTNYGNVGDDACLGSLLQEEEDGGMLSSRLEPVRAIMKNEDTHIWEHHVTDGMVVGVPAGRFVEMGIPTGGIVLVVQHVMPSLVPHRFNWGDVEDASTMDTRYCVPMEEDLPDELVDEECLANSLTLTSPTEWPWYARHGPRPADDGGRYLPFLFLEEVAKIEASSKPHGMELIAGMSVAILDDDPPEIPEPAAQENGPISVKQDEEAAARQMVPRTKQAEAVVDMMKAGHPVHGAMTIVETCRSSSISALETSLKEEIKRRCAEANKSFVQLANELGDSMNSAEEKVRATKWMANLFGLEDLLTAAKKSWSTDWKSFTAIWDTNAPPSIEELKVRDVDDPADDDDLAKLLKYFLAVSPTVGNGDEKYVNFMNWMYQGTNPKSYFKYRVLGQGDVHDFLRHASGGHDVLVVRANMVDRGEEMQLLLTLLLPAAYSQAWRISEPVPGHLQQLQNTRTENVIKEVFKAMNPIYWSGKTPKQLRPFVEAAIHVGAQMRALRLILDLCGNLPLSSVPMPLLTKIVEADTSNKWVTQFWGVVNALFGRERTLPTYKVECRRLTCMRCGHQTKDLREPIVAFMCRLCQGHLCQKCEVEAGSYGPVSDDLWNLISRAPVDLLTTDPNKDTAVMVSLGLCPCCFLTFLVYVRRDPELVQKVTDAKEKENASQLLAVGVNDDTSPKAVEVNDPETTGGDSISSSTEALKENQSGDADGGGGNPSSNRC